MRYRYYPIGTHDVELSAGKMPRHELVRLTLTDRFAVARKITDI